MRLRNWGEVKVGGALLTAAVRVAGAATALEDTDARGGVAAAKEGERVPGTRLARRQDGVLAAAARRGEAPQARKEPLTAGAGAARGRGR